MNRILFRPVLLCLIFAISQTTNVFGAITFHPVSPASVTLAPGNGGLHRLNLSGVTSGETVRVEKFLDLNSNGTIETNIDLLVQSFTVTDQQIPTVGGVRDINQPGDNDDEQGLIEIRLGLYSASEFNQVAGQYIFRITSVSGPSTPSTRTFVVQQATLAGTISGNVVGGGPAVVVVLDATKHDGEFVAGAVASATGVYSLNVPIGNYKVVAIKKGFVDNIDAAPVTPVTAVNPNAVRTLTPLAGTRTITGHVVDQDNGDGLPGVQIFANSTNGFVAIGATDASGSFALAAAPGIWRIDVSEKSLPLLGYLAPPDDDQGKLDLRVLASGSKFIALPRGQAIVSGSVLNTLGGPVPFVRMRGQEQQDTQWRSHGFTDANGSYSLLALANDDSWSFGGDPDAFAALNLIAQGTNFFFQNSASAFTVNFTAPAPTTVVSGFLVDSANNPVAGIEIGANFGNQEYQASAITAADGSFALGLVGGFWSAYFNNQDDFAARGLIAPEGAFFFVTDGINQSRGAMVAPRTTLQISGRLANTSGSPIPFVQITANNSSVDFQTNYHAEATTDTNGNYRLAVFDSPHAWSVSPGGSSLGEQGYYSEANSNVVMNGTSKVVNFILPPPPFYPFDLSYGVVKGRSFRQIPSGLPVARAEIPFIFNAFAEGVQAGSALLRPPAGPTRFLSGGLEEPFASMSDLNAAFPNGTFNFAFNTYSNGVRSANITLTGDAYPNAPTIKNLASLQQLGANTSVVLEWDPFIGGTSNDFIQVHIEDDQGNEVYSTPGLGEPGALGGTVTSTFLFGSFQSGRQFKASLLFAKIVNSNRTSLPGAFGFAAYFSETRFPVAAIYQPDAAFLSVFKGELFTQAVQAAPLPDQNNPNAFRAQVDEPGTNATLRLSSVQLETPNQFGNPIPLSGNPGAEPEWSIAESYPSGVALDAARPDGLYRFTVNGSTDGTKTMDLNLAGNAYPDIPQVINLDSLQRINPGDRMTVNWTALAAGTTNDFLVLQIFDDNGAQVFSTPARDALDALHGTDTTAFVPPFTLLPGHSYKMTLRFERTAVFNTTDYPGAVGIGGYFRETSTTIKTGNSPNLFPVVNSDRNERAGGFAFDGENYLLGLNADNSSNAVQLISLSGQTIGKPLLVGSGAEPPQIAFDGTNYLVAWIETAYGNGSYSDLVNIQFVSPAGQLLGNARSIAGPGNNRILNSVVFGANRFLLVWQERQPISGNDVFGQFIAAGDINGDALPATTPFVIGGSILDEVDAAAAFTGGNFLVAYQRPLNNAANSFSVFGHTISPAGALSSAVQLSQTPSARHNPMAVGVGNNSFFVTWSRDVGPGAPTDPSWDIFGRIVSASGQPTGNEFPVSAAAGNQILPSVAFDGSTFLVGWIDTDPNDIIGINNRARGRFFNPTGAPINQPFALLRDILGRPPATIGLSFTGDEFLAVATYAYSINYQGQFYSYFGGDVFGSFIPPMAPMIFFQPRDQDVAIGESALFLVGASGDEPITYQWRTNGVPIPNQTNFSLLLSSTTPGSSANYSVVVSNRFGSVTSSNAVLRVLSPPTIVTQPQSQTNSIGGNVTFTVAATGDGTLHYQWSRNGRIIPGANGSSLVLTTLRARDLGAYVVTVENEVGAVASLPAFLHLGGADLGLSDSFAGRITAISLQGIGTGTTTDATKEVGEPRHAGHTGGKSVWYSWTAPASGVAIFSTEGSAFDTVIAIYTGTTVNNLVPVASDDDSGGFGTSIVRFNATLGQTYAIAIDGYNGDSGDVVLGWTIQIGGIPVPEIVQQPVNQSLPIGTNATFAVVAQSPGSLFYQWYFNDVAIAGQTGPSVTIANIQPTNAGSYHVVIDSGGAQIISSIAYLEISTAVGVNSDDKFSDTLLDSSGNIIVSGQKKGTFASVSAGVLGTQILDNFGSGKELGEPIHAGVTGGSSRWFSLRPEADGVLVVDTIGSDIDTVLAVYTGTNLFTLTEIASDNNSAPDGIRSLVRFNATAGTFYRIAVDAVNGAQGHINLNWSLGNPPIFTNTPTASQIVLIGTNITLSGAAIGTPDPAYQWRFNGVPISGATNSGLSVNNFQDINAGTYTLVASNYAGTTNVTAIVTISESNPLPRVSVVSPGSNSVFNAGSAIVVSASASDFNDGPVARVEFFRGTTLIGQSTTPPYSVTFSTTTIGTNILTARATDFYGGSNTSMAISIRVVTPDKIKPTLTISAPLANARLSNELAIVTGKASDNTQVVSVEARLNEGSFFTLVGTTNWTGTFTLSPGTNTFRLRSTDLLGNISVTNVRSVYYVVTDTIGLGTSGVGTVKGLTNGQLVEVGKGYRLTATPGAGNLFSNWTANGSFYSTNPVLNFLMSSNLSLTANFVVNPFLLAKGTYTGLVGDTNAIAFTNAGLVSLIVSDKGAFSGKLLLAGGNHVFSGGFQVDGRATVRIPRTGKPALTNQFILDLVGNESLGGSVSDGAFNVPVQADKAVYASTNPAPYAGKYTLIIAGTNEVAGDGIGTVTLSAGGTVALAGTLADGTVIGQTAPVSRDGWWPLYVPLYTGRGMVISWVQFDTNGTKSLHGDTVWTKNPIPGKYYTNGLVLMTTIEGGQYVAPAVGPTNRVLALTNATVTLTGGNLPAGITNNVVLTNNNVFVITGTSGLKLTLTPASGLISGSFTHPQSKVVTQIKAVVQQGQTNLHGFFLGTNQSGQIILEP